MTQRDPLANPAELIRRVYSYVAYRIGDGPGADLRAREIGEIIGIKTNAVEVALHRALAKVRADLVDEERAGRHSPVGEPAPRIAP